MKIRTQIGVATEAQLRHPTACFRLSKALTQISNALSFGEFYFVNSKGKASPRDMQHISASLWTTGTAAKKLSQLLDDAEMKKAAEAYSRRALSFNDQVRKAIKTSEKPTYEGMKKRAEALREDLKTLESKVEGLCTVDAPKQKPALQGRTRMSGSSKRPIYPRYFVASMGRTR